MDMAYGGQFTEEVLTCVLEHLPLKCDTYDQDYVLSWLCDIYSKKEMLYISHLPQIVKCFTAWLDESMDLSDQCVVWMSWVVNE